MDIAQRDQIINALRLEIKRVQGGVLNQLQDIGEIQKENEVLRGVAEDYKKYHRAMITQKRQEKEHLEMLVNYLEKSLMEAGMTEAMENQIRFEQNRILKNIDNVTESLEEIISKDNLDEQNTD